MELAQRDALRLDVEATTQAISIMKFSLSSMERELITRVGESEFDRTAQEVLRVIRLNGQDGRTESELAKYCRAFKALEPRRRNDVLEVVCRNGEALKRTFSNSTNGKQRVAWVAMEFAPIQTGCETSATVPVSQQALFDQHRKNQHARQENIPPS